MKRKKIAALASVITVLVIVLVGYLYFYKTSVTSVPTNPNAIAGKVTSVTDKPIRTDDGKYHAAVQSIDIQSSSGQKYTINATSYINSPLSSNSVECVGISSNIKIGDKVEFYLPKAQSQANLFDTCYAEGLTGYYVNLY
jgi:hypothetical protein